MHPMPMMHAMPMVLLSIYLISLVAYGVLSALALRRAHLSWRHQTPTEDWVTTTWAVYHMPKMAHSLDPVPVPVRANDMLNAFWVTVLPFVNTMLLMGVVTVVLSNAWTAWYGRLVVRIDGWLQRKDYLQS